MARAYSVTTQPTSYPVTTAEAKAHLKVDISDDDTLISNLIVSATQSAEDYTNRCFINTTLKMVADKWSEIDTLYKSPVASVTNIKYYDTANTQQTLASSVYIVDNTSKPCRILLDEDQEYPDLADRKMGIEVNYVVGETEDGTDASNLIKQAILLMVGHWYQNREAVVIGRIATEIPMAAKMILDQYKIQVC
tara:strand:+ start:1830 stop:2408 length:579 start_codon:yes stop_codon:yes gene_type:complete